VDCHNFPTVLCFPFPENIHNSGTQPLRLLLSLKRVTRIKYSSGIGAGTDRTSNHCLRRYDSVSLLIFPFHLCIG
jgi:hypothetical protein